MATKAELLTYPALWSCRSDQLGHTWSVWCFLQAVHVLYPDLCPDSRRDPRDTAAQLQTASQLGLDFEA